MELLGEVEIGLLDLRLGGSSVSETKHLVRVEGLHGEEALELAQPRLGRVRFVLGDGQVLCHGAFNDYNLLNVLTMQAKTVRECQDCEIVVNCEMIQPKL